MTFQPQTFQPWTFQPHDTKVHGWKFWGWKVRGQSLGLKSLVLRFPSTGQTTNHRTKIHRGRWQTRCLARILKGQSVLAICSEGFWDCWVWRGARPMSLIWLSSRGCEIYADPPLGPDPAASCPNLTLLSLWFQTTRSYHGVKNKTLEKSWRYSKFLLKSIRFFLNVVDDLHVSPAFWTKPET